VRISVRSLGSKSVLSDIAGDIVERRISSVCVTMDRDYDAHFGRLLRSKNVIYTRGYSWENELLQSKVVETVFYELAHVDRRIVKVRGAIRAIIEAARVDLKWLTHADALLCAAGSSLFDRKKVEGAVGVGAQAPRVKRDWLRGELRKRRIGVGKFWLVRRGIKFDPITDCYGKVVSTLAYRILWYLLRKHTKQPSLSKHYGYLFLTRGVVDRLVASRGSRVSKYYCGRISRVVV
jgi:hypothetical protein